MTDGDDALSIIEGEIEQGASGWDESDEIDASQPPAPEIQTQEQATESGQNDTPAEGFSERGYRIAFPDIAQAIDAGEWVSGWQHYTIHGGAEARLDDLRYRNATHVDDSQSFPSSGIDAAFVSSGGWCLVVGWINDEAAPLRDVACLKGQRVVAVARHLARCRREDAETAVAARHGKLLGFWTVLHAEGGFAGGDAVAVRLTAGREQKTYALSARHMDDEALREVALEYLASARYFANPQTESAMQMASGLGQALVGFNIEISQKIIAGAYVTRFGPDGPFDASIIVCLYGKSEYLFLQAAFFSGCPGADRHEFIYVSNSPELAETLIKEATMAARVYAIAITLVILPSNAGFGAANNVAAEHARSRRIMIVNPDVFPRGRDWATRHSAVVENLPAAQTAIFGAPLYYDDGSLMHAGMFFDIDTGVSIRDGRVERHEIIRVEHYAKGAPPDTAAFLASRPVPAVTGAFISLDRGWFEALGGFSLEYVFGHYEDADLCLKSLARGVPVWVHNVPFWHLEGKGSTRRHVHEGGSTVNRWHFTHLWRDFIASDLRGRAPVRLAQTPTRPPIPAAVAL